MSKTYYIDANWKRWIAENLLLGASPDHLAGILIQNGFDATYSRLEIEVARTHPYLAASASIARHLKKREWILHNSRMLEESHSSGVEELWNTVETSRFFRDYYAMNQPLIVRGAVRNWPAVTLWTKEYLIEKAGNNEVQVQAGRERNKHYETQDEQHKQFIRFADYVNRVFSSEASNDIYMTARNNDINGKALASLWPDFDNPPDILDRALAENRTFFWIGPPGTVTPLHHDLSNIVMLQVVGRKRVKLISPNYAPYIYNHYHCYSEVDPEQVDSNKFPLFSRVKVHDITIGPGDMLFLPVGWWHHVRSLEPSITISATNFKGINYFDELYTT